MAEPFPTRSDLFRVGASEVFVRSALRPAGTRIKPEAVFTDGTDANILVAATAAMGDEAVRHLAARMGALYIDSARGEDLDRLVADRVSPNIPRKQASRSLVYLSFSRVDSTSPTSIPIGTSLRTSEGTQFTLLQEASLTTGSVGPVTALAQATIAGRGGNVGDNTVQAFVESPPQEDISVTNDKAASGGQNVESDAEYRSRAKDFYRTIRRATLSAIEFGALTVPGISRVTVVEEVDTNADPTGRVFVYIADIEGRANQALEDSVYENLLDYRAAGIVPSIQSGQPEFVDVGYSLLFESTVDTRAASERIKTATVAYMETLRPGSTLEVSALFSIARSVPGVIVPENAISAPVGDLVPTTPETLLRTTVARVTVNGL